MNRLVLTTFVTILLMAGCAAPCTDTVLLEIGTEPAPLYVCCGPGGCVAVSSLAECGGGDKVYNCQNGQSTTIDGKPAVICHD